jgi:hypothetical protein
MVIPLATAVATRVAGSQAVKKFRGPAAQQEVAQQTSGPANDGDTDQEREFPWTIWTLLTVIAILIDSISIVLGPASPIIRVISIPIFIGGTIIFFGGERTGGLKKVKVPKMKLLFGGMTLWTLYMLSFLFFRK